MPKFNEVGLHGGAMGGKLVASQWLDVQFGDDVAKKLRVTHTFPSKQIQAKLTADKWSLMYNLKTQDVDLECRKRIAPGELQIRQRIPSAEFAVVPSPELKLTMSQSKGKLSNKLITGYDMLNSRGMVEDTLDIAKRFKLAILADTISKKEGMLVTAKTQINEGWGDKSVGIQFSKRTGACVLFNLEKGKRLVAATNLNVKSKSLDQSIEVAPMSDCKVRLKADISASVRSRKPALRLGMRYVV